MPADFNPSFAAPHWGWWIVLYFFFGGVTGGIYFAAAWLDLFGDAHDRPAIRTGHLVAFPLLLVCTFFLIVDLGQPQRFWHMLFESERFPLPILKPYSPMSFGSLILFVFGAVVFLSFLDALLTRKGLLHAPGSPVGKLVSIVGALGGLALAGYTGVLLNVTNEPVWGNSPWISALFLFSGLSSGLAALVLLSRRFPRATFAKLSEADNYIVFFELITLIAFLVSLALIGVGSRFIFGAPVMLLFAIVLVVGLVALVLHFRSTIAGGHGTASMLAAVLVLIAGFLLRWAVLAGPQGIGL